MRAVIQRVSFGEVVIDDQSVAKIDNGLVVLLGVENGDGQEQIRYLARKIANLRIFSDNEDKMNEIIGSVYEKTPPLPGYKMRLLQSLKEAASVQVVSRPIWRVTDWAIIAAILITLIIIYGLWVPQGVLDKLVP